MKSLRLTQLHKLFKTLKELTIVSVNFGEFLELVDRNSENGNIFAELYILPELGAGGKLKIKGTMAWVSHYNETSTVESRMLLNLINGRIKNIIIK